jgi:hypothetical protein
MNVEKPRLLEKVFKPEQYGPPSQHHPPGPGDLPSPLAECARCPLTRFA